MEKFDHFLTLFKKELNDSQMIYNCSFMDQTFVESCFEPFVKYSQQTSESSDILDGGCCEKNQTGKPICCVIGLTQETQEKENTLFSDM